MFLSIYAVIHNRISCLMVSKTRETQEKWECRHHKLDYCH